MKRYLIDQLAQWKTQSERLPLVIYGARQVGKTWLMEEFGDKYFGGDFVRFDLYKSAQLRQIFEGDLDIPRIIKDLSIFAKRQITKNTLIIIDEIQESDQAKLALKYFAEDAPEYFVMAAGSYLGLSTGAFPVGKTESLVLYPLSFFEFLEAVGEQRFVDLISNAQADSLAIFHTNILDLLKTYFIVGGMPRAVQDYVDQRDLVAVRAIQNNLLVEYDKDFSKHLSDLDHDKKLLSALDIIKIKMIWESIPSQLSRSKSSKRFMYSAVKTGSKGRDYKSPLYWLAETGLIYKIDRISKPALPISTYQDTNYFKLFMFDIGLMGAMAGLDIDTYLLKDYKLFSEAKGAFAEQFVLQELKANAQQLPVKYWASDDNKSEVDFVIQTNNKIVPIEVKSSDNTASESLNKYIQKYHPDQSVLLSTQALSDRKSKLTKLPLYMTARLLTD